jgi:hypothetical protein
VDLRDERQWYIAQKSLQTDALRNNLPDQFFGENQ